MQTLRLISIIAMAFGLMATANAQSGQGSVMSDGSDGTRPERGSTQAQVEAKWGAPVTKVAAVGEPPISRWEYQNFTVYFEYDRVIHAVLKR
jgi:hypothetical protein